MYRNLNLFDKLKNVIEKEKSTLSLIMLILGVSLTLNAFLEIINILLNFNFYLYTNHLFIINLRFCYLLFGILLILIGFFSKIPKSGKIVRVLRSIYSTIGIGIVIISLMPLLYLIESSFTLQVYLNICVVFIFAGASLTIYNLSLLSSRKI